MIDRNEKKKEKKSRMRKNSLNIDKRIIVNGTTAEK